MPQPECRRLLPLFPPIPMNARTLVIEFGAPGGGRGGVVQRAHLCARVGGFPMLRD